MCIYSGNLVINKFANGLKRLNTNIYISIICTCAYKSAYTVKQKINHLGILVTYQYKSDLINLVRKLSDVTIFIIISSIMTLL